MISAFWILIALGFGFVFGEKYGVENQKKKEKAEQRNLKSENDDVPGGSNGRKPILE